MTTEESIRSYLREKGHAYDAVIPDDLFEEEKDTLHQSRRSLPKNGPTYRDDRRMHSVHVIDLRDINGGIVGHLEWFNPEHHPILHTLIDYPLWWWKNRIRERNIV